MTDETHSVIVYPDNTYAVRSGDWSREHSDGVRACACASVHGSRAAARRAKRGYVREREAREGPFIQTTDLQEEQGDA